MEGKLAGLFSGGEQVGGVLDWKFEPLFADSSDGLTKQYKFVKWTLTAPTYWLFAEPGMVTVRLYYGTRYWEGEGNITSIPRKVYDTMVHETMEIVGEGQLVDKE